MRIFSVILSILLLPYPVVGQSAGDYQSAATGNWTTAATWQTYNGTSWIPAVTTPTSANGAITILSGHTVTLSQNVTADQLTVNAGGQLNITVQLTIANGSGTDLQVNGILDNNSGTLTIQSGADVQVSGTIIVEGSGSSSVSGTLNFAAGSTDRYARNSGSLPNPANTTWDLTSTCEITGVTTTRPNNMNQAFGNFTWNCSGQTSTETFGLSFNTIRGNFTVQSTGTGAIQFATTGNGTVTIGGNYLQTGGRVIFTSSGDRNVPVAGSFTLSGGSLDMATSSGVSTLSVAGNFSHTAGTLTRSSATAGGSATVVFNGSSPQASTSGGTTSGIVNYTVNSGATVLTGSSIVGSGSTGAFTLSSGGTLGIGSAAGITTSGGGNVQVSGTRSYNTGANYVYNGTVAQATGNGLPATVNNLAIANTAGAVTLGASTTVGGTLTLTSGLLLLGNNTLTLGSAAAVAGTYSNSSMIVADLAAGTGQVRKLFADGTGVARSITFPIGDNTGTADYSPVSLNFSAGNFSSASVGISVWNLKHPNNGSTTDYINRFWRITPTGISAFTCAGSFTYVSADAQGSQSNIVPSLWDGAVWTPLNNANLTPPTLTGTISSFAATSDVTGGESGALPIQLASFTGTEVNQHFVKLLWTTSTETNNYGIEVQKSAEELAGYETIAGSLFPGYGTSLERHSYAFLDTTASAGIWYYRLKQIDLDGTVHFTGGIRIEVSGGVGKLSLPGNHALLQNYPNPVNPSARIRFHVAASGRVSLKVYDLVGREVRTLMEDQLERGSYEMLFDATGLSSGMYIYTMRAGTFTASRKLLIVR